MLVKEATYIKWTNDSNMILLEGIMMRILFTKCVHLEANPSKFQHTRLLW